MQPRRMWSYSFPEAVLEPGETRSVQVDVRGLFRAEKLVMVGRMDEVRGFYKIKYSRLPLLDWNDVVAYSKIQWRASARSKSIPGRTTIEYRGRDRSFARTYLPSSVVYVPVDPLSYVRLLQVFVGKEASMPAFGGVGARFFGADMFGNCILLSPTDSSIVLQLKNDGDIQVRVQAGIMGVQRE